MAISLTLATIRDPAAARAADPPAGADELLKLVPPDASVVVTVEGLREQIRSIGGSRVVDDLRRVPAVRSWLDSGQCRELERSFAEVEAVLGVKLAEVRDRVLGDAVVLVLRIPSGPGFDPSQARGLLLLKARDPALLQRLVSGINAAQRESGELKRVDARHRASTTYHVREFPEGSGRPPEWFVGYPDGTFAFSNSEEMIRAVMDRKPPGPGPRGNDAPDEIEAREAPAGPGLGALPRLIAVRRRLPGRALARLYVDPRAVERLLALAPPPTKPVDARFLALLRRHLAAVDYAGAALVWRPDAIVLNAVETLEPSRADGWLRRWAGDTRPYRAEWLRVPPTALAVASAHVDFLALRELLYQIVPEADHSRLRNLESVVSGLMLGQDLPARILPAVGPGLLAYLDSPADSDGGPTRGPDRPAGRGGLFPLVVVVDLSVDARAPDPRGDRGRATAVVVSDAIENAFRTLLSLMALDEKRGRGRGNVEERKVGAASVLTLDVPIPFAFAIDREEDRLVLGTSAASVARYLECSSDPASGARFRDIRAAAFSGFETFVCLDLDALTRLAARHRDGLVRHIASRRQRPVAEVGHDLDQVLGLARPFRAAFVASRMEPDASALHRSFGLIPRDSSGASTTAP